MERRKFIKIMAASSAMMAANPFALVSPRPPIIEGGKYRLTFTGGLGYADEGIWTDFQDAPPGVEWAGKSFSIPYPDDPELPQWECCDIILNDKAALRHWIAKQMEQIVEEWKNWDSWIEEDNWKDGKTPRTGFNSGGDGYYDWMPFVIRNLMIGCGVINDRKLWDWFHNHPHIVNQYPKRHDDFLGKSIQEYHWNWDDLWVDNKRWGPASIKKIG